MESKRWLAVVGLLFVLLLPACAPAPVEANTIDLWAAGMPDDFLALVEDLRSVGAGVDGGGVIGQALFDVASQALSVDGESVEVFIFENESAREVAQKAISENARNEDPGFQPRPYFWSRGRMLILYDGENPELLETMNLVLGEPIIKPQKKFVPPGVGRKEIG